MSQEDLTEMLVRNEYLRTPEIIEVFRAVDRADFMPDEVRHSAYFDKPVPIGHGQTISQPSVVAFMIELLQPQPGETILDIGSGSGWTTALLARIVGKKGKVIAVDLIPELKKFGEKNTAEYDPDGIAEFFCGNAHDGWPERGPYDRILVSAGAKNKKLQELKGQLGIGGIIVIPIGSPGSSIWRFTKISETDFEEQECPGYGFVPLFDEDDIRRNEETRRFFDEHPIHKKVLRAILLLMARGIPPSIGEITNLVNQVLILEGITPLYSVEQMAEIVSQIAKLGLIEAIWVPARNIGEIENLIGGASIE